MAAVSSSYVRSNSILGDRVFEMNQGSQTVKNCLISGNFNQQGSKYGVFKPINGSNAVITGNSVIQTVDGNTSFMILNGQASPGITANGNWWGTADESQLQYYFYDNNFDPAVGTIDWSGYLSGPSATAPAP